MAEVRLSSHTRKSYLRLARSDRRLFQRVDRVIERIAEDPTGGKPLAGPLAGHRSFRVGSLRIVYRLEEGRLLVLVLDIAERGGVYR